MKQGNLEVDLSHPTNNSYPTQYNLYTTQYKLLNIVESINGRTKTLTGLEIRVDHSGSGAWVEARNGSMQHEMQR
jgi:hypothetical protein